MAAKRARSTKKEALATATPEAEEKKPPPLPGQAAPVEESRPIDWSAWLKPERQNSLIPEGVAERKARESALRRPRCPRRPPHDAAHAPNCGISDIWEL